MASAPRHTLKSVYEEQPEADILQDAEPPPSRTASRSSFKAAGQAVNASMSFHGSLASAEDDDSSVESPTVGPGRRLSSSKARRRSRGGGEEQSGGRTRSKGRAARTLRYPVAEFVPESPRLVLPLQSVGAWQERLERESARYGRSASSHSAPLGWYGSELQRICSQAFIPASQQLVEVQAQCRARPRLWEEGGRLWPLLLEVSMIFAAASHVVEKLSLVLTKEACNFPMLEHLSRLRTECFRKGAVDATPILRPCLEPSTAQDALAVMQAELSRLQVAGSALGAVLRFGLEDEGGTDWLQRILQDRDGAEAKGGSSLHAQFFVLVPCLELGITKLCELAKLVEQLQEDLLHLQHADHADHADGDFVVARGSLLEEQGSGKAEPEVVEEKGTAEEAATSSMSQLETDRHASMTRESDLETVQDDSEAASRSASKTPSVRPSGTRSIKKSKTQKLTPKSKPKR